MSTSVSNRIKTVIFLFLICMYVCMYVCMKEKFLLAPYGASSHSHFI